MVAAIFGKSQWNSLLGRSAKTSDRIRKRYFHPSENDHGNTATVVFLRHGQSLWNKIPTFSGWCDVPLTEHGVEQAKEAGTLLRQRGFNFDIAYTSRLQRARITCETAIEALEPPLEIPVVTAWQLNERHYGKLQGRAKDDPSLFAEHGKDQIQRWRREFHATPPAMDESHPYYEPSPAPLTGKLQ
jgi:2,3-bisphosphoglycerate-dependent phosphoglycerate mutase